MQIVVLDSVSYVRGEKYQKYYRQVQINSLAVFL